jgi:hypothetical protein
MPTFRNTLFHLHRQAGVSTRTYLPMKMEQCVPKRRHINSRRRGITQKKAYNKCIVVFGWYIRGVIDCNEWKTEKRHECANMGKVKPLELWWQLYRTSIPVRDLENFRPMDFCSTECTCCLENYEISYSTANVYEAVLEYIWFTRSNFILHKMQNLNLRGIGMWTNCQPLPQVNIKSRDLKATNHSQQRKCSVCLFSL